MTAKATRRARAINARAAAEGWKIVVRGHGRKNPLGLADFEIVPIDRAFRGRDEATEFVVNRAWDRSGLHLMALRFLKETAPESYVRAIYQAHQTRIRA